MNRRDFLKRTSVSAAMLKVFEADLSAIVRQPGGSSGLERRALGKTGEMLSIVGFGGIVVMNATTREASARVGEAVDHGVNYFDVAPSYGNAEEMLGPALQPYRKNAFLACKTTERSAAGSQQDLENSLQKLRTDHFDLYQLHAVTSLEDVHQIFSEKGAMTTFRKAREQGKVRFLGFSAHSVEAALALMDGFDFDTILFPFNFGTWHAGNFGPQVLERASRHGMGILCLKAMAKGPWKENADRDAFPKCWYEPLSEPNEASVGLRFTLSHPVTAAIPPGDEGLFRMALKLAGSFVPLTAEESRDLKEKALLGEPLFRYPSSNA